ncbi:MAG: hypothetical protein HY609_02090 [Deltaproteobacteria bacterium]|nr:hypothetical protein [Deltaproteobacteria bacterium]
MSTVYVVDARSRERLVYAASATSLPSNPNALVLRKGVTVGKLENVLAGHHSEHPLLIIGFYRARQSAGHVTPLGGEKFQRGVVVGGAGFGREVYDEVGKPTRKGDALRPFGRPIEATLLPKGTRVEKIETHGGSNRSTADAVLAGLKLMAELPQTFVLAEGQSDHTSAFSFSGFPEKKEQFPAEHRAEMFSVERLLQGYLRRRDDDPHKAGSLFMETLGSRNWWIDRSATMRGLSDAERMALGERREEVVKAAFETYREWRFKLRHSPRGYDRSGSRLCFLVAMAPDGCSANVTNSLRWAEASLHREAFVNSDEEWQELKNRDLWVKACDALAEVSQSYAGAYQATFLAGVEVVGRYWKASLNEEIPVPEGFTSLDPWSHENWTDRLLPVVHRVTRVLVEYVVHGGKIAAKGEWVNPNPDPAVFLPPLSVLTGDDMPSVPTAKSGM